MVNDRDVDLASTSPTRDLTPTEDCVTKRKFIFIFLLLARCERERLTYENVINKGNL